MSASADQDQGRNPSLKYFTRSTVAIYGRAVAVTCMQQLGGVGALERFRCNWCRIHVHVMCQ